MVSTVKTRADLLYVMSSTHDTCFRNLFWISLTNHMNEVDFSSTHEQPSLPPTIPSSLSLQFPRWWFVHWQVAMFLSQQGSYREALRELEPFSTSAECCELQASLLCASSRPDH